MSHSKPKRTHTLPPTTPLSQQVGGHSGVNVTEDESLLLKPTLPREIAFYQFVRDVADPSSGLHALKAWMPTFFGLLNLQGKLANPVDGDNQAEIVPATITPTPQFGGAPVSFSDFDDTTAPAQTIVLQNLLYGYRKPCILDVKLGTVLYDEDAPAEKKARMIKKAAATTSLQTGIRLTGFQVYSNHSPDPIVYGKAYGYGLKPEHLQDGIRNFFPCSFSPSPTDADLGTSPSSNSSAGLPVDTLLKLLTSLHGSLTDLRESFSRADVRMVGSSVLIIYEGDWERAAEMSGCGGGPGTLKDEMESESDEDAESGEIEVEVDEQGQIIPESIFNPGGGAFETSSTSSCMDPPPCSYTISLIDFAHTRVVPGEGPDQGVLMGMDTLIGLVARRRQEVVALRVEEPNNS